LSKSPKINKPPGNIDPLNYENNIYVQGLNFTVCCVL